MRKLLQITFEWETLYDTEGQYCGITRAKVPSGWFVQIGADNHCFYYPDPDHHWDGNSLD